MEEQDRGRVSLPASSSPYVLLVLGGATLAGAVLAGKIAVDAIQGDEPPRAGRTDFEESVRLVGSLLGISVTLLQIPAAIGQAKELLDKGGVPFVSELSP